MSSYHTFFVTRFLFAPSQPPTLKDPFINRHWSKRLTKRPASEHGSFQAPLPSPWTLCPLPPLRRSRTTQKQDQMLLITQAIQATDQPPVLFHFCQRFYSLLWGGEYEPPVAIYHNSWRVHGRMSELPCSKLLGLKRSEWGRLHGPLNLNSYSMQKILVNPSLCLNTVTKKSPLPRQPAPARVRVACVLQVCGVLGGGFIAWGKNQ